MSLAHHCDREPCDSWQRVTTDLPSAWLHVAEEYAPTRHFCGPDCLLAFYAAREPMETR